MNGNEYRCVMRYFEKSDTLFIKSCTPALKALLNIGADVEGYPLGEQVSYRIRRWIYHSLRYLARGKHSILTFKELGENFLAVKMHYDPPLLSISVQPFEDKEIFDKLYYSSNFSRISGDRFFSSFKYSMVLARQNNRFKIEYVDDAAGNFFSVGQNDDVSALLKNFCFLESDRIFRYCLKSNKFLHFADIFDKDGICRFFIIGMIPYHGKSHIILTFHPLSQHEYYRMISGCSSAREGTIAEMNVGAAVFKVRRGAAPLLIRHNTAYDMLTGHEGDLYYIYNSLILESLKDSAVISSPHRFGKADCIAAALPFLQEEKVFLFIFPLSSATSLSNILDEKLTPRENEIATLVSFGNSTSDVAALCGISSGTVKKTIANIYSKLKISSRAELVRLILLKTDQSGRI